MKKTELIPLLLAHKLIGELTNDDLEKMTVRQLEILKKELEAEALVESPAGEGVVVPEGAAEGADNEMPEGSVGEIFKSMCGLAFDPSKNGTCYEQCQTEFPEEFAKCVANCLATPQKPVASRSRAVGLGMNQWYHRPGTQGGELDRFFEEGKVGTLEEIAKFANCNARRVMIHIKHLIADFGVTILKAGRKNDDNTTSTVFFWSEKDKRRKGEPIEGKTAFPNGYPKDHPLYGKVPGQAGIELSKKKEVA